MEYCGSLNALYTLHYEHYGIKTEQVYRAVSKDGKHFEVLGCVFDNETLPKNLSRTDFRDPCPVKPAYHNRSVFSVYKLRSVKRIAFVDFAYKIHVHKTFFKVDFAYYKHA